MTLYLIVQSFRKHLSRNISIMIQLMLGSLIMMLAFASYNGSINMYNQTKKVIKPNVIMASVVDNKSVLDRGSDSGLGGSLFVEEANNLAYSIIKDKSQIEMIGKDAYNIIGYNEITRELPGILKCSGDLVCINSCDRTVTEMFKFKVKEGIDFQSYFSSSGSDAYIPLIISKKLEKENAIGSIVDLPNIDSSSKFKIIGVMDESYPTLFQVNNAGDPYLPYDGYYCIAGRLINNNYQDIFAKLKDGTSIGTAEQDWNKSLDKDKKFQLISLNEMKENMLLNIPYSMKYFFYGVIILILSSFGIISTILFSILKRKREFGVRIAVGASKKDIAKMITGEIAALFIISQVLSILIALLISNGSKTLILNLESIGLCLLIILVLDIISIIPALIRVFKMKPVELIHERR